MACYFFPQWQLIYLLWLNSTHLVVGILALFIEPHHSVQLSSPRKEVALHFTTDNFIIQPDERAKQNTTV